MIIKSGRVELHISNFMFLVLPLLFAAGYILEYLCVFLSIAVHELGHVAVASLRGCRLRSIKVIPVGFSASIDDSTCSKMDSIFIYSSGPAVNLLLSAVSYLIYWILPYRWESLHFFFLSNIYLAIFNLIPAIPMDGGRIVQELLADRMGLILTGRLLRGLAFLLAVVFIILGLYQLTYSRMNFSLLVIGLYIMVLFKSGKMEAALMNLKQIIYRRSRLVKKGIYPARDLVAMKSTHLGETIKNMDFDRFHFVYVLDDDLKPMGIFTESEIMESMLKYNSDMTFEELINIAGTGWRGKIPG